MTIPSYLTTHMAPLALYGDVGRALINIAEFPPMDYIGPGRTIWGNVKISFRGATQEERILRVHAVWGLFEIMDAISESRLFLECDIRLHYRTKDVGRIEIRNVKPSTLAGHGLVVANTPGNMTGTKSRTLARWINEDEQKERNQGKTASELSVNATEATTPEGYASSEGTALGAWVHSYTYRWGSTEYSDRYFYMAIVTIATIAAEFDKKMVIDEVHSTFKGTDISVREDGPAEDMMTYQDVLSMCRKAIEFSLHRRYRSGLLLQMHWSKSGEERAVFSLEL